MIAFQSISQRLEEPLLISPTSPLQPQTAAIRFLLGWWWGRGMSEYLGDPDLHIHPGGGSVEKTVNSALKLSHTSPRILGWWVSILPERLLPGAFKRGGSPDGAAVEIPPANAGDVGSIPGSGRSPGGGHDSTLQYFCLENPMDRGAWWPRMRVGGHRGVRGAAESWIQLSMHTKLAP